MLPTTVQVPDSLWFNRSLCEGAKALWCYLRLVRQQRFTFKALRTAVGICQNSLLKYLRQLAEGGWLSWTRVTLRTVECHLLTQQGRTIALPSDLILDPNVPDAAKWLWGLIGRIKSAFHYEEIIKQTGYCQETIAKYLKRLSNDEWLKGTVHRVMRRAQFVMEALNPCAMGRQAEVDALELGMALAKKLEGYSLGQYLLARMVKSITAPGTLVLENSQPVGLDNARTGGRLHYDLFLPAYKLALRLISPQGCEPQL